jgi:hypothetical protein
VSATVAIDASGITLTPSTSALTSFVEANAFNYSVLTGSQDSRGFLSLHDRAITTALVHAVEEQQQTIEQLRGELDALTARG